MLKQMQRDSTWMREAISNEMGKEMFKGYIRLDKLSNYKIQLPYPIEIYVSSELGISYWVKEGSEAMKEYINVVRYKTNTKRQ